MQAMMQMVPGGGGDGGGGGGWKRPSWVGQPIDVDTDEEEDDETVDEDDLDSKLWGKNKNKKQHITIPYGSCRLCRRCERHCYVGGGMCLNPNCGTKNRLFRNDPRTPTLMKPRKKKNKGVKRNGS